MTSYWQLLRDPRWQRKRLEVMQRASFKCESCDSATKTLNVHHTYYQKGHAPWDYPESSLKCLCEDCHQATEQNITAIRECFGKLSDQGQDHLLGYAKALAWIENGGDPWLEVKNMAMAAGIGLCFYVGWPEVIARTMNNMVDANMLFEMSHGRTLGEHTSSMRRPPDVPYDEQYMDGYPELS